MEERAYTRVTNAAGDGFFNTRSWLAPLAGYAFCRYTATGTVRSSPRDDAPRAGFHREAMPTVRWDGIVEPLPDGRFDCRFGAGEGSRLVVANARSATWDRAAPDEKGLFPARHSLVVLDTAELPFPARTVTGLRAQYTVDASYPTAPDVIPELEQRSLVRGAERIGGIDGDIRNYTGSLPLLARHRVHHPGDRDAHGEPSADRHAGHHVPGPRGARSDDGGSPLILEHEAELLGG
jgi:hypothetical protein